MKRLVSPGDANSGTQDRPAYVQRRRHDGLAQGATDALIRHRFVSVDAVGIHAEQHLHRVTSSPGHGRRGNTSVEPQRDRRMPQVIGAASALGDASADSPPVPCR